MSEAQQPSAPDQETNPVVAFVENNREVTEQMARSDHRAAPLARAALRIAAREEADDA